MKRIIFLNSISELDNVLSSFKYQSLDGYFVYPDFRLTYTEYGKYLLEIKQ